MKWLDSVTNTMDVNLSQLPQIVEDRGAGMIYSMVLQRVRHGLGTEQPHPHLFLYVYICSYFFV